MTPLRILRLGVALLAGAVCVDLALPWGSDGHRLIADYAGARLSPPARAEIVRLLALESGATLATISTWPDEMRSPTTAPWHYINFPRDGGCHYDAATMCVSGSCVVSAIERQVAVLASKASDEERLKTLKYVVHFVGDVHQPLHAGYADDRGGNSYQVQAVGRGTNLHALWDSGLIVNWPGGLPSLRAAMDAEAAMDVKTDAAAWAEESCRAVASDGFYPTTHKLEPEYATGRSGLLTSRLAAAGQRLAAVLNRALSAQ